MVTEAHDIAAVREALARIDPKSSAQATEPLSTDELYTPASHAWALDPNRPLVVGNRGVGKSVWSGVLADEQTRKAVAPHYPQLKLDQLVVQLGFHEAAGRVSGVAPSPRVLASLLSRGVNAESIWTAVLYQAVSSAAKIRPQQSFEEAVKFVASDVEKAETALRQADAYFSSSRRIFLLVFDALDRLASSWAGIRPLSEGILRLTLGMQGYRAMRAKVFMRTDQSKDEALFLFPDASKMRASRVDLSWHSTELYGLLFKTIRANSAARGAFDRIVRAAIGRAYDDDDLDSPERQQKVFSRLAGEFMGSDRRRGRTYTWVIDHLADAFGETTPRSFLITLNRAARARVKPVSTAIDHLGIREGVQVASEVRVDQLQEDYAWIRAALKDLEGLEVPCDPILFIRRWRDRNTVSAIKRVTDEQQRPGPIELENPGTEREKSLLQALRNIGVVEERSAERINMPDIFRVAARIKRRGGVRPPVSGSRRS